MFIPVRLILIMFLCASLTAYAQEKDVIDDDSQFMDFLENALENGLVNEETTQMFHQRSRTYWRGQILEYNQNQEKYKKALSLFHQNQQKYKRNKPIKIDRFESQIENFRRFDNRNALAKNPVLFIGSSSIVYWETSNSFPSLPVINRGFGGASLPEIIYYYDDIIKKHSPSMLIVYCDIDIEGGKSPDEAVNAFKKLVNKVNIDFPQTQILLLSMKPTLIDDFIGIDVRKNKIITNKKLNEYCYGQKNLYFVDITTTMLKLDGSLRSDIFLSDGMHLNPLGYKLWSPIIKSKIKDLNK